MTKNKRAVSFLLAIIMIFSPMMEVMGQGEGNRNIKTDQERVDEALKTLSDKWHKFDLDSDVDRNIVELLKKDLVSYGFDDIGVKIKSSSNENNIDKDGNINYFFSEPKTSGSLTILPTSLVFELTKGKASGEYKKNVTLDWDKKRVRGLIEEDIYPLIDEDVIKDENESLAKVEKDLLLPYIPDKPNNFVSIKWESSNPSVLNISNKLQQGSTDNFYKPFVGEVKRGLKDQELELTAKIKFNHGSVKNEVEVTRKYKIIVKGINDNSQAGMQKLLDDNYTFDKLKYSGTNTLIDKNNVLGDIQLPTLRNAGIKGNYKLSVSSNSNHVDISGFRANVFRPEGNKKVDAVLRVEMTDRDTNISVWKDLKIRIANFDEKELEEDLRLMEVAKENYFYAIKGNNLDEKQISENLKSFKEIYLEDGQVKVAYDAGDMKNIGVVADSIAGWENQERWRAFKSSKPSVISHENLIVYRQDKDTSVVIESALSIPKYEKYVKRYPENEIFKKLYKQRVSLELNVLNKDALVQKTNLDEEIEFLKKVYREKLKRRSESNPLISKQGAAAARFMGLDLEALEKSLYIDPKNTSAFQLAQSIFTLAGAGLNPREYKDKNQVRDLVEELENIQMPTGEFASTDREKTNLLFQLRSIIALDMVGGEYDEEKAVERLIDVYNRRGDKEVLNNKLLEAEGLMLIALSNHRDKKDVDRTIDEILELLKKNQNPQGGFDMRNASAKGTNTPLAIARIIEGLIAIDIDPLTDREWIKDGNTMLDALVRSKISEKADMRYNGYARGEEEKHSMGEATDIAFAALVDLKNQESIFHMIRDEYRKDIAPKTIEILNKEKNELEEGDFLDLKTRVKGENNADLSRLDLEWYSSDEEVALVDKGRVSGIREGKATISVRVKDTDIEDKIEIEVIKEKEIEIESAIVYFDKYGNWHIEKEPIKIIVSKNEEEKYTAFEALKEVADSFEGDEGWIREINGIAGPKDSGGWTFTINNNMGSDTIGSAELKEGDKLLFISTYNWTENKILTWKDVLEGQGELPTDPIYSIGFLDSRREYKIGEEVLLDVEILKDGEKVDEDYLLLSSDEGVASIDGNNKISFNKAGEVRISASLKNNKNVGGIDIRVVEEKLAIDEVLEALRKNNLEKSDWSAREVLGYRHSSKDLDKDIPVLRSRKELKENNSVPNVALNIISLVAAGENPYDYRGIDYVDILLKSQKADNKFIISSGDGYETTQAFAVIALDMAKADYEKEDTLKMLLSYQKKDGSFGSWPGLDSPGMVLTALGNHMDKKEVRIGVDKSVEYIKNNWKGENQYSLSAGIQGLLAVGVDLSSDGFDGIVDSLLPFYSEDKLFGNAMANEQALIALADLAKNKSMYGDIRFNANPIKSLEIVKNDRDILVGDRLVFDVLARDIDGKIVSNGDIVWSLGDDKARLDSDGRLVALKPGKIKLKAQLKDMTISSELDLEIKESFLDVKYIGDRSAKRGNDFVARISVENGNDREERVSLIVGVYDKDNNLLDYKILEEKLGASSEKDIEKTISIKDGESIRVFLWDRMEEQNILMKDSQEFKIAN